MISYHLAGKDEPTTEVARRILTDTRVTAVAVLTLRDAVAANWPSILTSTWRPRMNPIITKLENGHLWKHATGILKNATFLSWTRSIADQGLTFPMFSNNSGKRFPTDQPEHRTQFVEAR